MRRKAQRCIWRFSLLSTIALHEAASPASAVPRTWIGGSTTWNNNQDPGNWNPAGEPSATDDAFFVSADTVTLGSTNALMTLSMSGSSTLDLNGQDLTVHGLVSLTGANTNMIVGDSATLLRAHLLTIDGGAAITLTGGVITKDALGAGGLFDVAAGGTLVGSGTINLNDALGAPTRLLRVNGSMIVQSDPLVPVDPPPMGTLFISATSPHAVIDLDGAAVTGSVIVRRNQTLDINLPVSDPVGGTINLFHNSTLDIASPWMLDLGTMSITSGSSGSIPASTAYLSGGTLTQTGGMITVVDPDGTFQLNAPFMQNGGSLQIAGRIILNASSKIAAAATVTGSGSLTIAGGGILVADHGAVIDLPLRNEGTLDPAGSTAVGEVSVKQFTQTPEGKLLMQLGGFDAGQADRIVIDGSADFDGELRIGRTGSFVPEPGESFTPITYDSHLGSLTVLNVTGLPGLMFVPAYGANALTLTAAALFPGDADLSGRVDVKDLAALATNWQTSADWFGGDFNGDGFVNKLDLGLMALNWHASAFGPSFAETVGIFGLPGVAVPEPLAAGALLAGLLSLPRRRRR